MPSVLLDEDAEVNRHVKANLLREIAGHGPVIAVENSDAAIRAVRALPCFDLVVTDISLPKTAGDDNQDGISFARWLQESGYPALLTGYSAVFSEGQISARDLKLFSDFLGRTETAEVILRKFHQWIDKSKDYRQSTWKKKKNEVTGPDGGIDFSAGIFSLDLVDAEEQTIKELLNEGFGMQLAYPSVDKSHGRPFFVWCRELPDETFVEVFGQPYLYSTGANVDDAKKNLLVLMQSYYGDLKEEESDGMSKPIASMRKFLNEVFNE